MHELESDFYCTCAIESRKLYRIGQFEQHLLELSDAIFEHAVLSEQLASVRDQTAISRSLESRALIINLNL